MNTDKGMLAKTIKASLARQAKTKKTTAPPSEDRNGKPTPEKAIRLAAYLKWESAGKPAGDGVNYWMEAEKELLERM